MSALSDKNIHLITDRTEDDLNYVKELAEKIINHKATNDEIRSWNACTLKGAYNYTDMNRVLDATDALAEALKNAGYSLNIQPVHIAHMGGQLYDRYLSGDIPNIVLTDLDEGAEVKNILHNLNEIRNALGISSANMPELISSFDDLDISSANDIERMLEIVDTLLEQITNSLIYCGQETAVCGLGFYAGKARAKRRVYTADNRAVITADGKNVYIL